MRLSCDLVVLQDRRRPMCNEMFKVSAKQQKLESESPDEKPKVK